MTNFIKGAASAFGGIEGPLEDVHANEEVI
jgi:hypothetical protein